MARDTITPTTSWEQIATGQLTITVTKQGTGNLMFNETAADLDANEMHPELGEQIIQTEAKATYVKTLGADWELLVDGAL